MVLSERSGTWNVGTGRETSVLALLQELENVLGRTATRAFGPSRQGDVRRSSLDIGRIRDELGWEPTLTLAEGLTRLLD
jgi:UDP-glucose 4-epimerase